MKYARHRSRPGSKSARRTRKKRKKGGNGSWSLFLVLIGAGMGIFVYAQMNKSEAVTEIAAEFQEDVVLAIAETNDASAMEGESADFTEVEENPFAEIRLQGPHPGTTIARRGIEGDIFVHVIIAELPALDVSREYYEGWLVKPGVTDFFSTGELVARSDGKWALVYQIPLDEADTDPMEFSEVVITREGRNGDTSPSPIHVMEGKFE